MTRLAGVLILVTAGALGLVTTFRLRTRLPRLVTDGLIALVGAAMGVGGLAFVRDVGVASWLAAPAALAVVALLHVRALFARGGPLRT